MRSALDELAPVAHPQWRTLRVSQPTARTFGGFAG